MRETALRPLQRSVKENSPRTRRRLFPPTERTPLIVYFRAKKIFSGATGEREIFLVPDRPSDGKMIVSMFVIRRAPLPMVRSFPL